MKSLWKIEYIPWGRILHFCGVRWWWHQYNFLKAMAARARWAQNQTPTFTIQLQPQASPVNPHITCAHKTHSTCHCACNSLIKTALLRPEQHSNAASFKNISSSCKVVVALCPHFLLLLPFPYLQMRECPAHIIRKGVV